MSEAVSESEIREILRKVAKQRVVSVIRPGDVWVVQEAVDWKCPRTEAALRTCAIRGWVEVQPNAVPVELVTKTNGVLHTPPDSTWNGRVYRLTEAGWNAIEKSYWWVRATFGAALAAALLALATLVTSGGC